MITQKKLEIYKRYDGDIDGWVRVGDKEEKKIMSDNDWFEIQDLIQKITILKRGLASEEFAKRINTIIHELTDTKETANKLIDFA